MNRTSLLAAVVLLAACPLDGPTAFQYEVDDVRGSWNDDGTVRVDARVTCDEDTQECTGDACFSLRVYVPSGDEVELLDSITRCDLEPSEGERHLRPGETARYAIVSQVVPPKKTLLLIFEAAVTGAASRSNVGFLHPSGEPE